MIDTTYSLEPTAPKYDPCRLFKKGDRIRFKTWHGFQPEDWENEAELLGKEATVYKDQKPDDFSVHFLFDGEAPDEEWHATYLPFIELVTPVEELERYIVIHNKNEKYFDVCWKDDDEPDGRTGRTRCRVTYWYHQPPKTYNEEEAKAAAEAERDRLNAEYRKEQK